MKMPQDQIERIAALGYTEPEARFLYVVATHSGYFTMRHFNAFTEVSRGKRSMAFAQKLLKHAHATVRVSHLLRRIDGRQRRGPFGERPVFAQASGAIQHLPDCNHNPAGSQCTLDSREGGQESALAA